MLQPDAAARALQQPEVTSEDRVPAQWASILSGVEPDRVVAARSEVRSWNFQHVAVELLAPTVDAAVAATLLVEGIRKLAEHGVPRERLLKKLRLDREFWGTWAEIRAADLLVRTEFQDAELRLEEGKSRGAHADLRFLVPDSHAAMSVEVKAIGLSDDEAEFCSRMAPSLRRLVPPLGLSQGHAPIDAPPPIVTRELRRESARQARRAVKRVPGYPVGLRGAVVVAHGSETSYARRVGRRIAQAVRQLPARDDCWVAIYWSNGAPAAAVQDAVPWDEIPSHVHGFFLVGCGIAFPHRQLHCFTRPIPRDAERDSPVVMRSLVDQKELAALVLDRFERSSGVRATYLVVGRRDLIVRDGSRRILPFNLLLDADPVAFDRDSTHWERSD